MIDKLCSPSSVRIAAFLPELDYPPLQTWPFQNWIEFRESLTSID